MVVFAAILFGQLGKLGICPSVTLMVKKHVAELPATSVTRNVFVTVPTCIVDAGSTPESWDTVVPGQLSLAIGGLKLMIAEHVPVVAGITRFAGQEIVGV